ncbi:MAG: hypothetical protein HRT73_03000 [Flavobacteriales bacterium]|nr:hypothetical protein [Flavobacteriales bacterium]
MRSILIIIEAIIIFTSCSTNNNSNSESGEIEIIIDSNITHNEMLYNISVSQELDKTSRVIFETYQCQNDGVKCRYGYEYLIVLKQDKDVLFSSYLNIDIAKILSRKVANDFILSDLIYTGTNSKNQLLFESWVSGSGENSLKCVFAIDMMLEEYADYCDGGGIQLIRVVNPYE